MIVSLIVAVAENGVIGKDGVVPWRLSADLKYFKQITMGHHLIQGRVTYESIGKPLPGRKMVVISRNPEFEAPGCDVVGSLQAGLELAQQAEESEAFIGGGTSIYAEALPIADRMYYTHVHAEVEGDTYFPKFDVIQWTEVDRWQHTADEKNEHAFTMKVLERKSSGTE
ncbi:MAG: dihydrofolate reductase [Chloroflexi bacterium]|nr:MAG: dihydrofolate reductase [Chloroflexota bacterium]MBL1196628.1 dihydrofolate reductase [Chloroflexota bacterium]NOH13921.1 dihydrofolate reductase [Chloroflexota bacterium]